MKNYGHKMQLCAYPAASRCTRISKINHDKRGITQAESRLEAAHMYKASVQMETAGGALISVENNSGAFFQLMRL